MRRIVIFVMVLFCLKANSQSFKVLSKTGYVKLTNNRVDKLYLGDSIYVNGFISLLHDKGKFIELTNGSYSVENLDNLLKKDKQVSLSDRYVRYVFNSTLGYKTPQQFTVVSGAVDRGIYKPVYACSTSAVIMGMPVYMHWHRFDTIYHVKVMDKYDSLLYYKNIKDTTCLIDLNALPLETAYFISINGYKNMVRTSTQILDESIINNFDTTSVSYLRQAFYYKQNNLYLDAMHYYLLAVEKQSSYISLKNLFDNE